MVTKKRAVSPKTPKAVVVHLNGRWYVIPLDVRGRRAQIEATKTVFGFDTEQEANAAV